MGIRLFMIKTNIIRLWWKTIFILSSSVPDHTINMSGDSLSRQHTTILTTNQVLFQQRECSAIDHIQNQKKTANLNTACKLHYTGNTAIPVIHTTARVPNIVTYPASKKDMDDIPHTSLNFFKLFHVKFKNIAQLLQSCYGMVIRKNF